MSKDLIKSLRESMLKEEGADPVAPLNTNPEQPISEEGEMPVAEDNVPKDWADELSIIRDLHQENLGRQFSDEQFNAIIESLIDAHPDVADHLMNIETELHGLLVSLDDATSVALGEAKKKSVKKDVKKFLPKQDSKGKPKEVKKEIKKVESPDKMKMK